MKKFKYIFFSKSQLIISYIFGLYLIIISIFAFDREDINVIYNYGFWFVFGCFVGFYWAVTAITYKREYKRKNDVFKVLKNDEVSEDEKVR